MLPDSKTNVNSRKCLQGYDTFRNHSYNCSYRACSLDWLKRFAHNELILSSNLSRPICSCGVVRPILLAFRASDSCSNHDKSILVEWGSGQSYWPLEPMTHVRIMARLSVTLLLTWVEVEAE